MEQILNKLSEIEATANAIMQDAARQKQALSEEAEKQTKEFDASLEKETSDEIRKIREDLAREKDARRNPPLHFKNNPATRSGPAVKSGPAKTTPGSMSFVQKPKTSYPGWMPITKPITKVFAVSCFRK